MKFNVILYPGEKSSIKQVNLFIKRFKISSVIISVNLCRIYVIISLYLRRKQDHISYYLQNEIACYKLVVWIKSWVEKIYNNLHICNSFNKTMPEFLRF